MVAKLAGISRSLKNHNYRIWVSGAFVSNIGTWMQRTAQDWLVLTKLTDHSASAVGTVMALQFGPQFVLMSLTGYAADHFDQRRVLLMTQSAMGVLAFVLGLLTVTGLVQLWHVYVFAALFGCATAFDAPVRQTFVTELVGDEHLSNAVALNSASFNGARMIGPAVSGLVIASAGTGWAFLINAASYLAVLISLMMLRSNELQPKEKAKAEKGSFSEGFRYIATRADLQIILVMLFLVGTFGLNFPIFISTMTVTAFHMDARAYGLLSSVMAIGTVSGSLIIASMDKPRFESLLIASLVFGIGCSLAALTPTYWAFGATLVLIGVASLSFMNSSNSLMQLSTAPSIRGRVMAIRLAIALGGTPLGAPIVGWVADHYGPRLALGIGAAAGFSAAIVGVFYYVRKSRI